MTWSLTSFTTKRQVLQYFDFRNPIFQQIARLPGIVSIRKIQQLRSQLEACERGSRILLHCGDCAESFQDMNEQKISKKAGMFKRFRKALYERTHLEPVVIGRIAGQYAKPRSQEFIKIENTLYHNFKGDNVNGLKLEEREPCPQRLLQGYFNSVCTHNSLAALVPEVYTSHEGLIVPYEAALTRQAADGKHYDTSAHMVWIGERNRHLDGSNIQFFRGVENPIGVKISSKVGDKEFVEIIRTLNPRNQHGKLLVIMRMGHEKIEQGVKRLIALKLENRLNCLIVSDPMHGNTFQSAVGDKLKTRRALDIQKQLSKTHQIL